MRQNILNSITEIKEKKSGKIIPIEKTELKFEASKYSSTKETIWHVFINDIKIKKTSEYLISYKCLKCNQINTIATTQFLRKIRQCKTQCYQCNIIDLNTNEHEPKEKIKIKNTEVLLIDHYLESIKEFEKYPDQYTNSYLLSHLSEEDYKKILKNIISFGNGKYIDIINYEYWSIYKVNNQMKFTSVMYDKINKIIFKANQPIVKCDNCEKNWKCKSLEGFKNCYKILCQECKLCNRTFKIRPTKNINNEIIIYQSKLELKFIEFCNNNNIILLNGPNVEYSFNNKIRKYRVDFKINDILIEIKDYHIWHKNQVASGLWDAKLYAVNEYIKNNNLNIYLFITPQNWIEKCNEIKKILKIN
jgi:hypothetical protein